MAGIAGLFYVRHRWARLQAREMPVVGGAAIPNAGPTAQPVSYEADYLDSADVKQLFKISDKTLYRWRQKGSIPFTTIGGKIVYPKAAIMGQLQQRLDDKYDPIHYTDRQKAD